MINNIFFHSKTLLSNSDRLETYAPPFPRLTRFTEEIKKDFCVLIKINKITIYTCSLDS